MLIRPALVVFGGGDVGEDRDQVGRVRRGGQHLRRADVGAAPHADPSVGVRERGRPLDGVEAVVGFVPERIELAFGVEPAAHVLPDHHVAGGGERTRLADAALPVVRRALEQRGEAAFRVGPVHVGHEGDAVAGLHLDADLDLEAVRLGGAPGSGARAGHCERDGAREDEPNHDLH